MFQLYSGGTWLKFYHGTDHRKVVKIASEICPGLDHRFGFTPDRMVGTVKHYFMDNGAFTSAFSQEDWINSLEKMSSYKYDPDFVVLPDVFDDREGTWERHRKYVGEVEKRGFDHYFVAQPPEDRTKGAEASEVVEKAVQLGSSGIFIGGSWGKPRILPEFLEKARREDLKVHIGMPKNLLWAVRSGADSFDTTSIARNKDWSRLEDLNEAMSIQKKI